MVGCRRPSICIRYRRDRTAQEPEPADGCLLQLEAARGGGSGPQAGPGRRQWLGVGDHPFVFAIGVIEPRKNLNRLMDAFFSLKQRGAVAADLKLVLAGGNGWVSATIHLYSLSA